MAVDRELFRLALFLFLSINFIDARECKIGCLGKDSPLHRLEAGQIYKYKLEGKTDLRISGSKGPVSTLGLQANVEIAAGAKCEHVITLKDIKVPTASKTIDAGKPLKFGLSEGKIEDLCTDEDTVPSLNIKRAVLSLLQTSILKEAGSESATEIDVFGSCPTDFNYVKTGNSLSVRKIKNLNRCAYRESIISGFSTNSYYAPSDFQTSNLVSGNIQVEQKFENGALKKAQAEEAYVYNPTNALEAPAAMKVVTTLTLVGKSAGAAPAANGKVGKSLIYEAGHEPEWSADPAAIANGLKEIIKDKSIKKETAQKFNGVLSKLQKASLANIQTAAKLCHDGVDASEKKAIRKLFLDAIFSCQTAPCTSYIAELLAKEEFDETEAKIWFTRLGVVRHATQESLRSTIKLLNEKSPTSAYLGIGMLGGKYCKQHGCDGVAVAEELQKKLGAPLLTKGCKPGDIKSEDKVIASMKGLGNMNYLSKPVLTKLLECVSDSSAKTRVRAAALDTLRTDAHKSEIKDPVGKVFGCPKTDSELRIRAYLVLAECPCGKVASWVKEVLTSDKSSQVGSFIVSHLRNVRASTNPSKAALKHHLGKIISTKKYPFDIRKYSQNHEFSYNLDLLNVGATAESNVIFSQKSYVPRGLSMNLTTQLFGHSFNWLQVDARLENIDKVLERLLGPKGYFKSKNTNEVYEEGREYAGTILEKIASRYDASVRPKREAVTRNQLDDVAKNVDLGHESEDDLDLDLSLKTFGSEVAWMSYHESEGKWNTDNVLDTVFGTLENTLNKAKNIDTTFKRIMTFGNAELDYPTSMGIPMKIRTNGLAALRLKVDGKLDIPAIMKEPDSADIRFQIIPSAAIDLSADIVIDAIVKESGARLDMNLHTSTGTDLSFRLLDGKGFDLKVGLPVDNQEIVNFHSSFKKINDYNDVSSEGLVYDVKREEYSGCFDQLKSVVGLTLCGAVGAPWDGPRSLSPAYGPVKASLNILKEDDSLNTFHVKVLSDDSRSEAYKLEALIDTPNTKENRKVAFLLEVGKQKKQYLKASVNSPWTDLSFDGAITETPNEASINLKLKHDETEYGINIGLKSVTKGNQYIFTPILDYKAPEFKSAMIGRRGGPKPQQQAYSASGEIVVEKTPTLNTMTFKSFALNTPRTKYVIDGKLQAHRTSPKELAGVDGDLKLSWDQENIQLKGHHKKLGGGKLSSALSIIPSSYPDFSIDAQYEGTVTGNLDKKGSYKSKFHITHGPDPKSTMSRIAIESSYQRDKDAGVLGMENKITYPVLNLEGGQTFKVTPKSLDIGLKGKLDKYSGEGKLKGDIKKPGEYNAEAYLEAMGNSVKVNSAAKLIKNNQARYTNAIELKPGGKYELNAVVTNKKDKDNFDYQVAAEVKLPAEPKILKVDAGMKNKGSAFSTHLKALAGPKEYISAKVDVKGGELATLNVKLLDLLEAKGESKNIPSEKKIKSNLLVKFPRIDKSIEAKAELVDGIRKGTVSLCWDTKDPLKTIKLEYDNDVTLGESTHIKSKSALTLKDDKIQLNLEYRGDFDGDGEPIIRDVELILPDGHKLKIQSHSELKTTKDTLEFRTDTSLANAPSGSKPQILNIVARTLPACDFKKNIYQGEIGIKAINEKEQNLEYTLKFDVQKPADKWLLKGDVSGVGSLVQQQPFKAILDTEIPTELMNDDETGLSPAKYHFVSSYGNDLQIESNGKIGGSTVAGDFSAKLPETGGIKSVKWTTYNVLDVAGKDPKVKIDNSLSWNGDKFIKENIEAGLEQNGVNFIGEWESNKLSKRKLTGSAHWSEGDVDKADATAALTWEGKSADFSVKAEKSKDGRSGSVHVIGNTPENGKIDVVLKNKIIPEKKGIHTDLTITSKDMKVAANSKIEIPEDHPMIDINVDHPGGKSRFFYKADRKGDKHWASEMKVKWTGEKAGSLSADSEFNVKSPDTFFVKSNMDAPTLDIKKWHMDLTSKVVKDETKKLILNVKKNDKLVISANTNYNVKEDGNTLLVEGSGTMKTEDKQYPVTFKSSWLNEENNQAAKVDVKIKDATLNIDFKLTPTEYLFERVVCPDPKHCSKFLIANKIVIGDDEIEQTSTVLLDFNTYIVEIENLSYQAKSKTTRTSIDQSVEFKYGPTAVYKYKSFIHPKEAGVLLTIPSRTVGAEIKYDATGKDNAGSMKLETNIWFDKNKNDKMCILALSTIAKNKGSTVVTGETKVTHPALSKDLLVKGRATLGQIGKLAEGEVVVDIFNKPDQKIVLTFKSAGSSEKSSFTGHTSATLKSEGCKINAGYDSRIVLKPDDYVFVWSESAHYLDSKGAKQEALAKVDIGPKKINSQVKVLGTVLLEVDGKLDKNDKQLSLGGTVTSLGKKYKENIVYTPSTNNLKYLLNFDGKSLEGELGAEMGKKGIIKVIFDNKEAGHLDVALDEANFLKSNYAYDADTIKSIFYALSDSVSSYGKETDQLLQKLLKQGNQEAEALLKCLTECLPDLSKISEHAKKQLETIKSEILSDKSVSELVKTLNHVFGKLIEQAGAILAEVGKFLETIAELIQEGIHKAVAIWKEVSPKILESIDRLTKIYLSALEEALKVSKKIIDKVVEQLKAHEADIKEYLNVCADFVHEFGKQFGQVIFGIHDELKNILATAAEQLMDIPIVNTIKEKMQELKEWELPEEFWMTYYELVETIKELLPTPECESFFGAAADYLAKALRQEKLNPDEVTRDLITKLEAAVRSVVAKVAQILPKGSAFNPQTYLKLSPAQWTTIPRGGLRMSILNLLLSKDLPSVYDIIATYHPSLNLLDNIPPFTGLGVLLAGTEIVTFDGRHIGFKGSCNYVLAEDYEDRNFSLVAHINGGKLEAVSLSDSKDTVTIKNGKGTLNGKQMEYPMKNGNLVAWRRPNGLGMHSRAGVLVICSNDLEYCEFHVSGFYFNKVRGLLGNMNYEKFDDLKLPAGSIAQDDTAFGNGWKIGSCGDATSAPHTHTSTLACQRVFEEALIFSPWAPIAPYKAACDHLTQPLPEDKQLDRACQVLQAYTRIAQENGAFFARLPDICHYCTLEGKKLEEFDEVRVPYAPEKIDIVFVVEGEKDNEKFMTQTFPKLVSAIKKSCNANKLTDQKLSVVSFSPIRTWPDYHTTEGEIIGTDVPIKFEKRPKPKNATMLDRLEHLKQTVIQESGFSNLATVYRDILDQFNFRPTARKVLIGIHSEPCDSISPGNIIGSAIGAFRSQLRGIRYHLIIPVNDLDSDDIESDEILGFDDSSVITKAGERKTADVEIDHDNCATVSQLTDGFTFPMDRINDGNLDKIAQAMTKYTGGDELECGCDLTMGIIPKVSCLDD